MNPKKNLWAQPVVISCALTIMSIGAFAELDVDHTKKMERDRNEGEVTADPQKMNRSDADITKKIRQSLVKDKSLSTFAKNIKIITMNGEVTLKGHVKNEEEELKVVKKANLIAGNTQVINQLEISTDSNK